MKYFLIIILQFSMIKGSAQEIHIIPQPVSLIPKQGNFSLSATTKIVITEKRFQKSALFLNIYLQEYYHFQLPIISSTSDKLTNAITLQISKSVTKIPGAYELEVSKDQIQIKGDENGIFYAIQSLVQLLPLNKQTTLRIPQVSILDSARFAYRGMMLDVGRHFFPVSFVKKFIDFIAMHKMNTFHWHLTEDQGWRIEIKKYPRLTEIGGFRNGTIIGKHPGKGNDKLRDGGFYTQTEIKEIVKYADDRYITVLPEIELPGHASAAIAAYPELSCFPLEATKHAKQVSWNGDSSGKQVQQSWGVYPDVFCPSEYTFQFLQNVLDEVMSLFPGKYIHIGGDECPKDSWKRSPFCQQLIKEKGLKDEHGLQSYFIQRIEKYINSKGKQIIGWDEILEGGLAPNASVMSWRGEKGGIEAVKLNHAVIMTPGGWVYLDHSQTKQEDSVTIGSYLPLQKVYGYEPIPAELSFAEAKLVMGSQGNVWTEYMKSPSKVEYMIFPRMSALSEVLWSKKESRNWDDFTKRLETQVKRYQWMNIGYSKAYLDSNNK